MRVLGLVARVFFALLLLFFLVGALGTPEVSALPAGFQEFYVPLPSGDNLGAQPYNGTYSVFNYIEPPVATGPGMHYVVGVTASADNTTVYYDHWENGYQTGPAGDEVVPLNKGQVHVFESSNIPVPRGTTIKYDGGDRVFVSGSLLQLVVSTWTEDEGTVFTDAWEVYPVQAWETTYAIPAGENLALAPTTYRDFTYVFALVMSQANGNNIVIADPAGPGLATTLNHGQTAIYEVKGAGTTVTASAKVQVQLMTGRRDTSGWEMRGYTITPRAYWGTGYYAPVPSWSGASSNLYIYNPNASQITVNFEDLSGTGSFTVDAGATRSYRSGTGRYIPIGSGAYVYNTSGYVFWAIAAGDTGSATWDWGYDLIPTNFLGTDNYVSWAPGTSNLTSNGSPVYVTALNNNTTVFVDYGPNDGVFDVSYKLNRLQVVQVYDPDKDNTGMHIVSTAPVAVAWGESPDTAGAGNPFLDMGYTTLPLPIEWIDVALQVEKTANPTQVYAGQESQFTVVVSVPATAGAPSVGTDLVDKMPPGWQYVAGSGNPSDPTTITGSLATGYVLTWDANWTINPGGSQTVTFRGLATASADVSNPNRNVASATGQSLGVTLTADDDAFVDVLRLVELPQVGATKADSLFIDADGNLVPSPGDTLKYLIVITNSGNGMAAGAVFTDTPDPNTSLLVGSVDVSTCPGCYVTSGNDPGDTMVAVTIGDLDPGATVQVSFMVTIGSDGFTQVANQGTVAGTNFASVPTDDPDTPGPNDPTITPVTIGPPVLTISKSGPAHALVDSMITYTGVLSNISHSTAYNVVLVDQLAPGVTFVSSSHAAVYDPVFNTVTWNLGSLPPGVSIPGWVTVHIDGATPDNTVLTDTFSVTWEDHQGNPLGPATASCDTTVHTQPQLTLEKTGPSESLPGQVFSYTLTMTNVGGANATNVVLTDTLPAEVQYVGSNPPGVYNPVTHTVTWNLGTIPPGGSPAVPLTVQVIPVVTNGTDALDTANVTWQDELGGTYGPVSAEWHTIIYTEPELVITKFGPEEAVVDSTITYTGTLTNVGGSTAYNVVLVDQLPPWVTFVSSSHSAVYNHETNTVTWHLGNLSAGASIPGWLTVYVAQNTPDGTVLTDTFSVTAEDQLGNPVGPATASWDTTVHTSPVLVIEKSGPATTFPLETVQYTIKVTNIGGSDALNATLVDALPIGFTYDSSTPPGTHAGGFVTWNLGTIPAYSSMDILLAATVDGTVANLTTLVNTASVLWQDSLGRNHGPATAVWPTTVYTRPQLTINKTGPARAMQGDTISYTIEVCNIGGTDALNGNLTDLLPGGVTYVSSAPAGVYDPVAHAVTWDLGAIAPGACTTVTVMVSVNVVPDGTLLDDVASVTWKDGAGGAYGPASDVQETLVNSPPHLALEKTGPAEARQGDQVTYDIEVCNIGGTDAVNSTLYDLLPVGLTYVSSNPSGTHLDGTVLWDLGTIAGHTCVTVQVTASVDFGLPPETLLVNTALATWRDPAGNPYGPVTATAETLIRPSLVVTKDGSAVAVFPGEMLTYHIAYQNLGTTTLTGVVVTEFYDSNVHFVSANPPPYAGTDNVWTIGTLAPGASGTIDVKVQASWDIPGGAILRNDVKITSDQGAEGEDPEKTTVKAPPVLEARKTVSLYTDANGDHMASPGDTLLYAITISNTGDAEATGVVFTDTPDPNTKLVAGSISTSQGAVTGGNDGVPPVVVAVGSIPVGGAVEVRFRVTINSPISVMQVANQGVVSSNELRDVPTNEVVTEVHQPPAVPVTSQVGIAAMITLFAASMVMLLKRRVVAVAGRR